MEKILSAMIELLLPLRSLDSPERIKSLLAELGYALPEGTLPPAAPLDFNALLNESLELVVRLQTAETAAEKLAAVAEATNLVRTTWEGANSLYSTLNTALQSIPQFMIKTSFQSTFLKRLLDYLVVKWLQKTAPRTHSLLELVGICTSTPQTENLANYKSECALLNLHLERIPALIQSPSSVFEELYGWNSGFDSNLFLSQLALVMRMFGLPGNLLPDDNPMYVEDPDAPEEEKILFMPVLSGGHWPDTYWQLGLRAQKAEPNGSGKPGLALVPYAEGQVAASVPLGDKQSANLALGSGIDSGVGIFLRPPADLEIQKDLFSNPAENTDAALSLELVFADPSDEIVIFGSATGSRLSAREFRLKSGLEVEGGEGNASIEISLPDWALVVDAGESDSFINSLLAALPLEVTGSLLLEYSLQNGFRINSDAGLSLVIPVNKTIGPVSIDQVALSLLLDDSSMRIDAGLTGGVTLGPLMFVVDNVGLSSVLDWAAEDGLLGDLDVTVQFKPPDGIGLAIDAGPVSGGGFLYIVPEAGEYNGVLDLDLLSIGISAVGLIDTKLPGGGWSMFLALFIDLPSIPLGFGFTLNGVGGVAGINRTLDVEGLRSAIRAGTLDSVLFPEDPIADAPIIIDTFKDIFPSAEGRYVFGPVIQIGWGSPTLIEAEIGIVVSLPDPITIAVLGTVTSILPTDDTDMVALHLEVAGIIDMASSSLSIDASLHGSHMAGFPLSGDMALRSSFGDAPTFLMALGGSHPAFDRPSGFPEIERLSLAINAGSLIDIRFDCYFAITSNSLQFGASFEMTAEVEGFGINGGAEFDALVTFSPFSLRTGLGYHISVKAAGVDLMAVWLDVTLSGPNPWRVVGTATFTILGIDNTIKLDETIGSKKQEELPDSVDVLGLLRDALALPEAWSIGAGGGQGVTLSATDPLADELVVTPDGTLGVTQKIVPLGITIDKSDPWQVTGGYNHFDLETGESGMTSTGNMTEWFAVSSYLDLKPSERLSAPSFEQLKSGMLFGGGDPTAGKALEGTLDFDQSIRDPEMREENEKLADSYNVKDDPRKGSLAGLVTGQVASSFTIAADDIPQVVKAGYAVTNRVTGEVVVRSNRWTVSRASTAGRKKSTVVVPTWEVES